VMPYNTRPGRFLKRGQVPLQWGLVAERLDSFDFLPIFESFSTTRADHWSNYPTFWNLTCVAISFDSPAVRAPICE